MNESRRTPMYTFKIESMNCMSCVHNIDDALKEVDQNVEVKADLKNKILSVESSQPLENLKRLIEEAGYPVADERR